MKELILAALDTHRKTLIRGERNANTQGLKDYYNAEAVKYETLITEIKSGQLDLVKTALKSTASKG